MGGDRTRPPPTNTMGTTAMTYQNVARGEVWKNPSARRKAMKRKALRRRRERPSHIRKQFDRSGFEGE